MIHVHYIKSGCYSGGEDEAYDAGIKRGDTVCVLTSREYADTQLIHEAAAKTPCLNPQDPAHVAAWIAGAARRMEELREELERQRTIWLKGCDCAPEQACAFARERDDLRSLVRSLFQDYLDVTEESELTGREFKPIHISCSRAAKIEPLGRLLVDLRRAAGLPDKTGGDQ